MLQANHDTRLAYINVWKLVNPNHRNTAYISIKPRGGLYFVPPLQWNYHDFTINFTTERKKRVVGCFDQNWRGIRDFYLLDSNRATNIYIYIYIRDSLAAARGHFSASCCLQQKEFKLGRSKLDKRKPYSTFKNLILSFCFFLIMS